MDNKVIKKNVELEIASLKEERAQIALKLTGEYADFERVVKKMKVIVKKLEKRVDVATENRISQENENKSLIGRQKKDTFKHLKIIKSLKVIEKQKIRKLEGLNFRIMNAERTAGDLGRDIVMRKEDVKNLETLQKTKVQLEKDISRFRLELNSTMIKLDVIKPKYVKKISQLKTDMKNINDIVINLEKRATLAKYAITDFGNELARKKKDLNIYIKRAEKKYKKAFPHLIMKLK